MLILNELECSTAELRSLFAHRGLAIIQSVATGARISIGTLITYPCGLQFRKWVADCLVKINGVWCHTSHQKGRKNILSPSLV